MIFFSQAIVTTHESSNTSPILVSLCKLNIPGIVVVMAFSGILLYYSYHNRGSEYMMKPYREYYSRLILRLGI